MTAATVPTDVLVAVSDRNATAVLLLADALYWAAERYAAATQAYEDATDLGTNLTGDQREDAIRRARRDMQIAGNRLGPLSDRYEALMARITDDGLYARVEAVVWRDRKAEYEHAREVLAREQAA